MAPTAWPTWPPRSSAGPAARSRRRHVLIASDHSHSGPDTIGAWGGVPESYLKYIHDQTVAAIVNAYKSRYAARLVAGHSDASDLIYNQSCSEALNQDKEPTYPGPEVCATPGKDGMVRVVQARRLTGPVVATFMSFAAHSTAGGGNGLHGDWPQFLSDTMTGAPRRRGPGDARRAGRHTAVPPGLCVHGRGQPGLRRRAAAQGGDRLELLRARRAGTGERAARHRTGGAAKGHISEVITGPAVTALFAVGSYDGARLLRSRQNPWVVGNTIRTVTSAIRVGGVLFSGTPGEGFPAIGTGVRDAVGNEQEVIQLGLANDQLGYLIAPAHYVPIIAAEAPVNDNIIFNVSPTIGDHVMCSNIRLALATGFEGSSPAACAAYDAADSAGDPVAEVPVGGVPDPVVE